MAITVIEADSLNNVVGPYETQTKEERFRNMLETFFSSDDIDMVSKDGKISIVVRHGNMSYGLVQDDIAAALSHFCTGLRIIHA